MCGGIRRSSAYSFGLRLAIAQADGGRNNKPILLQIPTVVKLLFTDQVMKIYCNWKSSVLKMHPHNSVRTSFSSHIVSLFISYPSIQSLFTITVYSHHRFQRENSKRPSISSSRSETEVPDTLNDNAIPEQILVRIYSCLSFKCDIVCSLPVRWCRKAISINSNWPRWPTCVPKQRRKQKPLYQGDSSLDFSRTYFLYFVSSFHFWGHLFALTS